VTGRVAKRQVAQPKVAKAAVPVPQPAGASGVPPKQPGRRSR